MALAATNLGFGVLAAPSSSRKIPVSRLLTGAKPVYFERVLSTFSAKRRYGNSLTVKAFFNVENEPLVKEALKEPIAFFGGVFAGLLRLDLNEDPLREWIARTAEAAGIEFEKSEKNDDSAPEEIQIE
ncbi:hypothetical protein O6H91_21G042000 [Diphasiastrum complanatum]|uniref:Uncharacterized protein n=1 Tax=Diphasiastrum complanatum TaxID=34168 RepID=A0ACC2AJU5_DIPCM|nr:hypothetical protein O6H91_21G042000 [Diphasiastrum complanatum]